MPRTYLEPFWRDTGPNVWADAATTPQTIVTSPPPNTIANTAVWIDWVGTNQTTGTYALPDRWPQYVWQTWQTTDASSFVIQGTNPFAGTAMPPTEPSPETRRMQLMARNRTRARHLRNKQAERRAEQLLLECLSSAQRTEWLEGRCFHVQTADGCRRYRIAYGTAGNVRLVEVKAAPPVERGRNGGIARLGSRFCMHVYHPEGPLPAADNCLAQKLLIEADEATFIREANISYA